MPGESPVFTGFFTDGTRRIDLVLVLKDDGDENIDELKTNFLLNAIKVGLEIEIEPGMMKKHQNLIFVKVHAHDPIIEQYGEIFNIRKHFKDSHEDFINAENKYVKFVKRFIPFFTTTSEKEWVKLVRRQYPGPSNYSTLERSHIVYRMLLVLPFGIQENYIGLERLIHNNIVLDAYALHDGPYFFVPQQDAAVKVNARQILYSNWIGADALLKPQPVCLLQEYFGEKVAFYFAFCEYLNRALIITASVGISILYLAVMEQISPDGIFEKRQVGYFFCENDHHRNYEPWCLCPKCRDFNICPFIKAIDCCKEVKLKFMLESVEFINFDLFIIFWAIVFVLLWRRRENYLSWFWEMDEQGSKILRPGYKVNFKSIKRSKVTGILKSYDSVWVKMYKIFKNIVILFMLVIIIFPVTILWANFQYKIIKGMTDGLHRSHDHAHFAGLIAFSTIYVVANTVFDKAIQKLSHLTVRLENHRTQDAYERSLIQKQFIAAFAFMFSYFVFLAFVKGRLYTYPFDLDNWNLIGGIGMMNCGLFTCLDELCVLLGVTILLKSIVFKAIPPMFRFRTDYNERKSINAKIPCWEREYQLNDINEQFIIDLFKNLAIQFALCTLFVQAFPLTPLIVLIGNVLNVRYNSWLLLLGSRRPLLHNATGMSSWRSIIMAIALASAVTNVLMMMMNTRAAHVEFYGWFGDRYHQTWIQFYSTTCERKEFTKNTGALGKAYEKYTGYKPDHCQYPGRWHVYKDKQSPMAYEWTYRNTHTEKLLLFQHLTFLTLLIPILLISTRPKDIENTVDIEERIKNQCFIRQKLDTD